MLTLIIQKAYCIAAVFLLCYCTVLLKQFEVTASEYIIICVAPHKGRTSGSEEHLPHF